MGSPRSPCLGSDHCGGRFLEILAAEPHTRSWPTPINCEAVALPPPRVAKSRIPVVRGSRCPLVGGRRTQPRDAVSRPILSLATHTGCPERSASGKLFSAVRVGSSSHREGRYLLRDGLGVRLLGDSKVVRALQIQPALRIAAEITLEA